MDVGSDTSWFMALGASSSAENALSGFATRGAPKRRIHREPPSTNRAPFSKETTRLPQFIALTTNNITPVTTTRQFNTAGVVDLFVERLSAPQHDGPDATSVLSAAATVACRFNASFVPPSISALNTSDASEARSCLDRGSAFYDACEQRCYTEMSILRLSQGLELEHVVYGHLFPVLVLLVVLANVFVVLVLSQKHMITPTNVVLKYMAIADLCVGLVPLPWNFFYHTLRNSEHDERIELWWCYMYKYSMDAVPPVCHNIAMWLTVLLAGQRYISIQYPLVSRRLCSVRHVRFATMAITGVSVLCGLPKSIDYYFEVYEGWAFVEPGEWIYLRSCLSGFTVFVKMVGSNTFFNAYFWTRVFGFILVPSVLLIILNALLIRGIRQAKRRKDRLLKEKRAREAQRQKDSNSTSIMLVVIVTIFVLVNLPQAVFMAMLCVQNTFGISNSFLEGLFPATFLLVSNMLVMATYPINFGIYCFMSSSFRDTFRMFFCRKNWRHSIMNRRGTMACGASYSRYTVRRSDPSLQFSDIGCSVGGGTRYSISDTMVIGNGIRSTSATVTVMPFLPLLSLTPPHSKPNLNARHSAISNTASTGTVASITADYGYSSLGEQTRGPTMDSNSTNFEVLKNVKEKSNILFQSNKLLSASNQDSPKISLIQNDSTIYSNGVDKNGYCNNSANKRYSDDYCISPEPNSSDHSNVNGHNSDYGITKKKDHDKCGRRKKKNIATEIDEELVSNGSPVIHSAIHSRNDNVNNDAPTVNDYIKNHINTVCNTVHNNLKKYDCNNSKKDVKSTTVDKSDICSLAASTNTDTIYRKNSVEKNNCIATSTSNSEDCSSDSNSETDSNCGNSIKISKVNNKNDLRTENVLPTISTTMGNGNCCWMNGNRSSNAIFPMDDYKTVNFRVGNKIADIADTDEKIREADAVYL